MKPGLIDVGYTAHPSFVTHEELGAIDGPLSIAAAGKLMIARYRFEKSSMANFACIRGRLDLHYPASSRVRGDPHQDWQAVADQLVQRCQSRLRCARRSERP